MPAGLPGGSRGPGAPAAAPRTGRTAVAWTAIAIIVAVVAFIQAFGGREGDGGTGFAVRLMETQVRMHYGLSTVLQGLPGGPSSDRDFEVLKSSIGRGPAPIRQRLAVVAGDLRGPAAARAELDRLEELLREKGRSLSPAEAEVQADLRALYAGDAAAHDLRAVEALPGARRDALRRALGWFGELALAPEGAPGRAAIDRGARRMALLAMGVGLGALALFGAGCLAALLYWLRVASRGAVFRMEPGAAPHGIYAETFAIWLLSFLVLGIGGRAAFEFLPDHAGARLALNVAMPLLSVGALAWPVMRGVPFAQVRRDVGLFLSPTPFRDALSGIFCWLAALPMIAVVGIGTAVVAAGVAAATRRGKVPDELEFEQTSAHPLGDEIAGGISWPVVLLLASVIAPFVEELFFRGVLYRHLRDATRARGAAASILISAAISGIVFGAVHPQGLLAAPLLAAVAWPLVHAREWRDSLVAPMAAHAAHNAIITGLAWSLLAA